MTMELLELLAVDVIAAFAIGLNVSWWYELNFTPHYERWLNWR